MTIKPDKELSTVFEVEGLLERLTSWKAELQQQQIKLRLHLGTPVNPDQQLVKDLNRLHIENDLNTVEDVVD